MPELHPKHQPFGWGRWHLIPCVYRASVYYWTPAIMFPQKISLTSRILKVEKMTHFRGEKLGKQESAWVKLLLLRPYGWNDGLEHWIYWINYLMHDLYWYQQWWGTVNAEQVKTTYCSLLSAAHCWGLCAWKLQSLMCGIYKNTTCTGPGHISCYQLVSSYRAVTRLFILYLRLMRRPEGLSCKIKWSHWGHGYNIYREACSHLGIGGMQCN